MTAATTSASATTTPPPGAPAGYLAATLGGLIGGVVLTALGIGLGIGLMEAHEDPNGGMANLGLLLFPMVLGALGVMIGVAVGVGVALERIGHADAWRTAWLTVPLTIVCLFLLTAAGIGMVLVPAVPAIARWIVLRTRGSGQSGPG